jgi:hypothetical protein
MVAATVLYIFLSLFLLKGWARLALRLAKNFPFPAGGNALFFFGTVLALIGLLSDPHPLPTLWIILMFAMTWKAVTHDYDWQKDPPGNTLFWRCSAVVFAVLSLQEGLFLIPWIYIAIRRLGIWTHHCEMPLRLLFVWLSLDLSSRLVAGPGQQEKAAWDSGLYLGMVLIHYWIPGIAKMQLGPRWFSWVKDNQLHCFISNAYAYGWLQFLPARRILWFSRNMKPLNQLIQALILLLEAGCLLFVANSFLFQLWLAGIFLMHVGIFLFAGLFFWEYMLAIALIFFQVPDLWHPLAPLTAILAATLLVSLKIVRPQLLAWWDSPWVGRIFIEGTTCTGKNVHVHNGLLCPHERVYGQIRFLEFLKRPLLYWHLGEAHSRDAYDWILAARGNAEMLHGYERDHGRSHWSAEKQEQEAAWLRRLLQPEWWNRKTFLPDRLRFLKAPGEHCFYWGPLPSHNPREPLRELRLVWREYFFDGTHLHSTEVQELWKQQSD